jgi:NTE family protein
MHSKKTLKQRALILGGGGALGAYQVGVLKTLYERLTQEDSKDEENNNNKLLFDIVAGTSIGAMNGAVLVSQYLKTGNWDDAIEQLEQFWTNKERGLASTVSEQDLQAIDKWNRWHEESKKNTPGIASAEAARRYYSVRHYFFMGTPNVQEPLKPFPKEDSRFFDDLLNKWYLHDPKHLRDTIQNFAKPQITTSPEKNEPRLLVFAVDAAEGKTVTFDSFSKADGSRKSEYGNNPAKNSVDENVIKRDEGVSIDQVMASGTLPEFYDYKDIDGQKFWDGGLLSNTPFREVLQAHQEYWIDVGTGTNKVDDIQVPDLEVYIINLHASKRDKLPTDHDGVKDRQNDIVFGDRSSHYDEKQAYLVADLQDFASQMKNLSAEAISQLIKESDKEKLKERFENILAKTASSRDSRGKPVTYDDMLLKRQYKLTKVVRIERPESADAIFGKTGDFTAKSIEELIAQGKNCSI